MKNNSKITPLKNFSKIKIKSTKNLNKIQIIVIIIFRYQIIILYKIQLMPHSIPIYKWIYLLFKRLLVKKKWE